MQYNHSYHLLLPPRSISLLSPLPRGSSLCYPCLWVCTNSLLKNNYNIIPNSFLDLNFLYTLSSSFTVCAFSFVGHYLQGFCLCVFRMLHIFFSFSHFTKQSLSEVPFSIFAEQWYIYFLSLHNIPLYGCTTITSS